MSHPFWPQPQYLYQRSRMHAPAPPRMAGFSGAGGCATCADPDDYNPELYVTDRDYSHKKRTWGSFTTRDPYALPPYVLEEQSALGADDLWFGSGTGLKITSPTQVITGDTMIDMSKAPPVKSSSTKCAANYIAKIVTDEIWAALPVSSWAGKLRIDIPLVGSINLAGDFEADLRAGIQRVVAQLGSDALAKLLYAASVSSSSVLSWVSQYLMPPLSATVNGAIGGIIGKAQGKVSLSFNPSSTASALVNSLWGKLRAIYQECYGSSPTTGTPSGYNFNVIQLDAQVLPKLTTTRENQSTTAAGSGGKTAMLVGAAAIAALLLMR